MRRRGRSQVGGEQGKCEGGLMALVGTIPWVCAFLGVWTHPMPCQTQGQGQITFHSLNRALGEVKAPD